jgi:predicted ATPase/DNA-binding SARP family transcriptional activator
MKGSDLLNISLLGPMEIRRGKRRIELPSSKKARGLLAYLIVNRRQHRRDRLTELLWDVADDPKAGLRWCLSKIRPLVDGPQRPRILADRETVEFRAEDLSVDSFAVRDAIKRGVSSMTLKELEYLASLFRGSFLEGLELPDYYSFQAWLIAEREDALAQQVSILRAIVNDLSDDAAKAIPYGRLLVERDPLDEHSRATLSGFLVRLGRHAEARRLIETGKRLASELGTGTSGVLEQTARELPRRTSDDAESRTPAEGRFPEWRSPTAMIGREEERERVRSMLDNSRDSRRGHVVLITGEAGVGKSRFLAELSADTLSGRGTALSGRSYEAEARRPYGPWIDAIRSLHPSAMGDVLRDELAPLLTGLTFEDERQGGRDRLFAAIAELLAARAHSAAPVLLQFDDVQWCDEASAELLHYVVRVTRHRPVSVVLAARSGELPDNEAMMRVLRGFRQDRWIEEIELAPLSRKETNRLVSLISPSVNADAVFDESGGIPLYAIELARASDRSAGSVDPTLAVLIRDRIDRLPVVAGDVLRWAAVLGSTFNLQRLVSIVSLGFNEVTSAVEILDRHALLREISPAAGPAAYGFTHNVVRRAVYDGLSEPRRRLMHWRIAKMFEQEGSSTTMMAAQVAHHAALAGEAATAARASAAAGRYCLRIYANGEALAFARSGMRYSEALPEPERVGLQIDLTEVSLTARRPRNVEKTAKMLEELSERALFHGDVAHARLGFHILSYLRWERGDWLDARRHSLRAEFIARSADPREQIVAMAEAARCLALLERDLGQAEALALEARVRATHAGVEIAAIPDALGMLRFHQGAWDEAAKLFDTARELSQREGDRIGEFRALEHLVVLELERNGAEAAGMLCCELVALAEKLREGSEAPFARCLAALVAEASGEDMAEELDAALESLRMVDAKHRLAYALLRATQGDFERGGFKTAKARAEEALRLAEILERPTETAMAHVVLLRCALFSGAGNDVERHREALRHANLAQVAVHVRRAAEHICAQ